MWCVVEPALTRPEYVRSWLERDTYLVKAQENNRHSGKLTFGVSFR